MYLIDYIHKIGIFTPHPPQNTKSLDKYRNSFGNIFIFFSFSSCQSSYHNLAGRMRPAHHHFTHY